MPRMHAHVFMHVRESPEPFSGFGSKKWSPEGQILTFRRVIFLTPSEHSKKVLPEGSKFDHPEGGFSTIPEGSFRSLRDTPKKWSGRGSKDPYPGNHGFDPENHGFEPKTMVLGCFGGIPKKPRAIRAFRPAIWPKHGVLPMF